MNAEVSLQVRGVSQGYKSKQERKVKCMSKKEELEKYLEKWGWFIKADKAVDLAVLVLNFVHDKLQEEQPHAWHDIMTFESVTTDLKYYFDE